MSLHPRRRTVRTVRGIVAQWPAIAVLAAIWVLLWGDLSWANVIAGALLAVLIMVVFPLPPVAAQGRFRLGPFLVLAGRFVADLVVASFHVAFMALRPRYVPRGAVVVVQLRNPDDVFLTITAVLSTLVPGSLVVEAQRRTGLVYLHVLDIEDSGGVEGVRRNVLQLEERVLRAFASDDVLAQCDVPQPGGRTSNEEVA
ncbi:Na+/H+ antiporter subunit E [Isoptericola sp. NEAU-Y5]|uniref:Na+/H+ antiporter subunit E n=1 Tax=Isoptericola luteus TaxID=2879484 RepID=A0ABS7ZAD7_9MICO|nr:Na+/H+ antiporter subunit E [Isoptericola sp. NEAU-Y5]MCA5892015.1 Na+/H+ antiporter subunit E [Isoptericola sp. NEAU-Y5]